MSPEYLELALQDGVSVADMRLIHRSVGDLMLPSGRLVACDPFVCPEATPFTIPVPTGVFPVTLSIVDYGDDQRVAFATIRFRSNKPASWQMLTVGDQDLGQLEPDNIFGYPVDAGTGCFMDPQAGRAIVARMTEDQMYFETFIAEMNKTYRHTWSWFNLNYGNANLIAFSSGYGDGLYASYGGLDASGEPAVIVTDFGLID